MMKTSVASQVRHNASRFPAKPVLVEGARRLTYAELDAQADACANMLASRGVASGDRIAILAPSDIDWIVYYLGIGRIDAIVVPLNWKLTADEVVAGVATADVKFVLVDAEFDTTLARDIPAGKKIVVGGERTGQLLAEFAGRRVDLEVDPKQTQVILFTGGTTGAQKGVMLSHENIFWNTIQLVVDTEMHEDDVTVLATPLHHAGALIIWLIPHLYLGATAVLLPKYSPEALIETIAAERVTNGWTPPSMTREVLTHPLAAQRDLRSFARWYVAGGPFPRRDREAMKALIPGVKIFFQYGLTEAGVMVTVLKDKDYERAPDSIGRAFLHCSVKILREDLSDADPGEVGEIAMRSQSVMKGYFKNPEATTATFHDGWLRTGDLGAIDRNGYVQFHDRLKDMVKTGGFNVYSQEVEQVLLRHPAVREVAVLGVPSDKWGEEVVAVVVVREGDSCDVESILRFAREHLAKYKVPKQVRFLEYAELPINYSGKIVKKELRERFRSA